MKEEYILYQKFTDVEVAQELGNLLKNNGLDSHLEDNQHSYVKIVGYNSIDFQISLNLKPDDFPKADKILEEYYLEQIPKIDTSYYLFHFSNEELQEVILNPFDWGHLDFHLAKHILNERGISVNDNDIQKAKDRKINELTQVKNVSALKLLSGYLLSLIMPIISILIGLTIVYNRNILPSGQKFYIHSPKNRTHGRIMITISIIWISIIIFRVVFRN